MNFQYRFKLAVPVDQAWGVLMDVKRIASCLPGAAIESGEGNDYVGRIKVKLGPIELTYRGTVTFIERDDAAKRAVINVAAKEVKGGGAAKATLTLSASASGTETEVDVGSDFTVSGKPAQFGRGVMEEVGEKLMAEFASRLSKLIATDSAAAVLTTAVVAPAMSSPEGRTASPTTVPSVAAPVVAHSATPQASSHVADDEALDILSTLRWPLFRRLAIFAGILVVIGTLSFVVFK